MVRLSCCSLRRGRDWAAVCTACASGTNAIGEAFRRVRSGHAA